MPTPQIQDLLGNFYSVYNLTGATFQDHFGVYFTLTPAGALSGAAFAPDTVSTNANVSLTGANVADGVRRTGLSDGVADTMPSAADIVTAVTGSAGRTFCFLYVNTTGFPVTLTAGTGNTFANTSGASTDVISAGNAVYYQVSITSATAITLTRQWAMAAGV
jgi:hypothetical protein